MSLKYAILAKLSEREGSGYEIYSAFRESIGAFWHASHQQIYRELSNLEAAKLASCRKIRQSGKPDKKVYKINKSGLRTLQEWICSPSIPVKLKDDFLLKLFVGNLVPLETLISQIGLYIEEHKVKLSKYHATERKYFSKPNALPFKYQLQYLTLKRGIQYEEDWLKWSKMVLKFLRENK